MYLALLGIYIYMYVYLLGCLLLESVCFSYVHGMNL